MANGSRGITKRLRRFIENQKIFFVGTAAAEGRVNVSPKGTDSLRVMDSHKVVWLNLTGSGNETAAHLIQNNRMTIMFCAFEGPPMILRLYGRAKVYHRFDAEYEEYITLFPKDVGARQIVLIDLDLVKTSCGFAVPLMDFRDERHILADWAKEKGESGIEDFWRKNNRESIDGYPTNIFSGDN